MVTNRPSSDMVSHRFRDSACTSASRSSSSDCDCWLWSCHQTWLSTCLLALNSECRVRWVRHRSRPIREVLVWENASSCQARLTHAHFLNSGHCLRSCRGWACSWSWVSMALNHIHHSISSLASSDSERHCWMNRNVKSESSSGGNSSSACLLLPGSVASAADSCSQATSLLSETSFPCRPQKPYPCSRTLCFAVQRACLYFILPR